MKQLHLERFAYSPNGTFGQFDIDGARLFTVERPWISNFRNVSCIPEGEYVCRPRRFFKGGYDAVEICEVPNRSHILFHRGNTPRDVEGCIAIGSRLGVLSDEWAVLQSRQAFLRFMDHYGCESFHLMITQIKGASIDEQ